MAIIETRAEKERQCTLSPKAYIFYNVSEWINSATININDIDYTEIDLSSLVDTYGNMSQLNACWGEKKY